MNSRGPQADVASDNGASEPAGRIELGQAPVIAVAKVDEDNENEALGICDALLGQFPDNEPVVDLE